MQSLIDRKHEDFQLEMSSKVEEMKALIEQSTATDYMGDNRPTLEQESRSAEKFYTLDEDTYTLMMFSKPWSKLWIFSLGIFLFQLFFVLVVLVDQFTISNGSTTLDISYTVTTVVRFRQILAIIASLITNRYLRFCEILRCTLEAKR